MPRAQAKQLLLRFKLEDRLTIFSQENGPDEQLGWLGGVSIKEGARLDGGDELLHNNVRGVSHICELLT
jgi:hypothetical protein